MKDYTGLSPEVFKVINDRHGQFQTDLNNLAADPVTVFDPLKQRMIDDLTLIRGLSKELQSKKDEEMKKAALAAANAEEQTKEEKEITEVAEEGKEEKKTE